MEKTAEPEDSYELVPLSSPAGTYNLTELRERKKRREVSECYTPLPTDMAASKLPWRTRSGPH